ncbi:hypothetical protein LshimejAT787_1900850 [Lyophyllum shimeji]|uniref:Uncharacterized protein n=1 Tax=Lyophyllum shimeji TaxID=47721 RepID=A0A9P3PXT6_LYOSH|nr:hypothetical protein LshimejAT787_1900850 [Lyophyllum shimeji]
MGLQVDLYPSTPPVPVTGTSYTATSLCWQTLRSPQLSIKAGRDNNISYKTFQMLSEHGWNLSNVVRDLSERAPTNKNQLRRTVHYLRRLHAKARRKWGAS